MAKAAASKTKVLGRGFRWFILYCSTKNYQTYLRSIFINLLTVCDFREAEFYEYEGNEISRIAIKFV